MKKHGLAFLAVTVALAGCGSDPKQDASNIMSGLGGSMGTAGSANALMAQDDSAPNPNVIREIRNQMEGAAWLGALRSDDAVAMGNPQVSAATPFASCPSSTAPSCTYTCPTTSKLSITCSTATGSATCNGTKYTMSNPSYTVTLDVSNVTGTGSSASGTMTLGMSFSASVTGGGFNGSTLACSMSFSVDITKLKAGTASLSPTCDSSFSCTYNGTSYSCADIQSKMASAKSSCS